MNQDALWDFYQNEIPEAFEHSLARIQFLAGKIDSKSRVLNIGVGSGFFEKIAISHGIDIYSLDPNKRSIEKIRDQFGTGEKAKTGYSQDIPFPDQYFTFVVASEVIEHLSDDILQKSLDEIHRVLVPNGCFIGTVPSRERISEQLVVCPHCKKNFHRWGHLQSFDLGKLSDILSGKFVMEDSAERYFVTWKTLNWKGKIHALLKIVLRFFGVHGSEETIYFYARKV